MEKEYTLTDGPIFGKLIHFALPVILALFLQSLYGAVDLIVVGHYATTSDVSGVSIGSQLMMSVTFFISALAMGVTVLVGNHIGEQNPDKAGHAIGSAICLFSVVALIISTALVILAPVITKLMQTPLESFDNAVSYIRVCGFGFIFITAYNLIGCIFRGMGDSDTPLMTVAISCALNIAGDLYFVRILGMGSAGAAWATVISQATSVIISFVIIRKRELPIIIKKTDVCFDIPVIKTELKIGIPIALQDVLVSLSFIIILGAVNRLGVVASAAMGVGEKVCAFIMLIPSAFSQSITAFVAQNIGAKKHDRCSSALKYGIFISLCFGIVLFYLTFFYGNIMAKVFSSDPLVIEGTHSYLRAYAIDCMLTPIMFCFVGYFNGYRKTKFVMLQGIITSFLIRAPWAIIWGSLPGTSLFKIGLGTPCTTFTQIFICLWMFRSMCKKGENR